MQEIYFDEILSTQDYAKKLILEGKEDFVVFANTQTNGRGRFSRCWEAPSGGLWFSFDNDFYENNGLFTITVGVIVREILEKSCKCGLKLKWPNDIILDNKKVCGIICEKVNNKVIIGIGINTNVKKINEEKAISFFEKIGISINNYELMKEIIEESKRELKLKTNNIIERFRENMAFCGEECFISSLNKNAKVLDIKEDGRLIVKTDKGIEEVFTGEINECI